MLGILLALLMLAGCLVLWIGVPLAWLWIGSQIEAAASLGAAMAAAMAGSIATIIGIAWVLSLLNRRHLEWRIARDPDAHDAGEDDAPSGGILEPMIVGSAALAIVFFAVWFLFFAGTSPLPLNIGY